MFNSNINIIIQILSNFESVILNEILNQIYYNLIYTTFINKITIALYNTLSFIPIWST